MTNKEALEEFKRRLADPSYGKNNLWAARRGQYNEL